MERREFLEGAAASSAWAMMLSLGLGGARAAQAASHEAGQAAGGATAAALEELREVTREIEASFPSKWWALRGPDDEAEARRFMLHVMQHALEIFLEGDSGYPVFKRFVTPEKKLLGDNPDAVYFTALIDSENRYRVRGNLADAEYTSFTLELGTGDGGLSRKIGGALNSDQFDADSRGNYEILLGPDPVGGVAGAADAANQLQLPPGVGSLTTRHYYERKVSVASDRMHHIPLMIERLDAEGPPAPPTDASIAQKIRRVANFVRHNTMPPVNDRPKPPFVSEVPNQFNPIVRDDENQSIGFAAVDNTYSSTTVRLAPDEALIVRGRFPECRFANVVLWNRYMQTVDYANRRCSLNRKQMELQDDGSFRVVVAHRDPGVPNWLDGEGRDELTMFWRFLLVEEDVESLQTKLVKVDDLAGA